MLEYCGLQSVAGILDISLRSLRVLRLLFGWGIGGEVLCCLETSWWGIVACEEGGFAVHDAVFFEGGRSGARVHVGIGG